MKLRSIGTALLLQSIAFFCNANDVGSNQPLVSGATEEQVLQWFSSELQMLTNAARELKGRQDLSNAPTDYVKYDVLISDLETMRHALDNARMKQENPAYQFSPLHGESEGY